MEIVPADGMDKVVRKCSIPLCYKYKKKYWATLPSPFHRRHELLACGRYTNPSSSASMIAMSLRTDSCWS